MVRLIGDLSRCEPQLEALVKLSKGGNDSPLEVVTVFAEEELQRDRCPQLLIRPCAVGAEKIEISIADADDLSREIRVENLLTDAKGSMLALQLPLPARASPASAGLPCVTVRAFSIRHEAATDGSLDMRRTSLLAVYPQCARPDISDASAAVLTGELHECVGWRPLFNGGDSGFLLWRKGLLPGIGVL